MKIGNIQPINVWSGGYQVQATKLGIKLSNDNLVDLAHIQYWLLVDDTVEVPQVDDNGYIVNSVLTYERTVVSDELIMSGATYANWGVSGDANLEALEWVADQLNLTLIP